MTAPALSHQLYPGVLTDSLIQAQTQLQQANTFTGVSTVHIDVIDGLFVDNVTITPADLPELDFGDLDCDLHLMTEEPLDFVYELIEHQEQIPVRGVIAQVERMSHQRSYLDVVEQHQWQVGVSLNLYTPIEAIEVESWPQLDIVQIMGVELGYQGQVFQPMVLEKVKEVIKKATQLQRKIEIIIDGGVKPDNVASMVAAGVTSVVAGSGLWQAPDPLQAAHQYLAALEPTPA